MKHFNRIAMAVLALASASFADAQFVATWSEAYNGTANGLDRANCVAVDKHGSTFVAGEAKETGTGIDIVVLKYSPASLFDA